MEYPAAMLKGMKTMNSKGPMSSVYSLSLVWSNFSHLLTITGGVSVGEAVCPVATNKFRGFSYLYHCFIIQSEGEVKDGLLTLKLTYKVVPFLV